MSSVQFNSRNVANGAPKPAVTTAEKESASTVLGSKIPEQDLNGCMDRPSTDGDSDLTDGNADAGYALFAEADALWDDMPVTLMYMFDAGGPCQQQKVRMTIEEWEHWAAVKFVETKDKSKAQIRIGFNPLKGNWSWVGTESLKHLHEADPTMNLGIVRETSSLESDERGIILHEFGHALGMRHEHQSPDRGSAGVYLDEAKTIECYKQVFHVTEDFVRNQVLPIYNKKDLSNFSDLDTKSIMMYPVPAACTKSGTGIPGNTELSEMDKAYITINYPRQDDKYLKSDWSLKRALSIAKVPDNVQAEILKHTQDVQKVRKIFSEWSMKKFDAVYNSTKGASVPATGAAMGSGSDQANALAELLRTYYNTRTQAHALAGILPLLQPAGGLGVQPSAGLVDVFSHPIFKGVASVLLKQAIAGLQPASGLPTSGVNAAVPSAGLIDFIRNPLVTQIIGTVANHVLAATQQRAAGLPAHGLGTTGFDGPSAGIMDVLRHPVVADIFRTVLGQVAAATQPSHGLAGLKVDEPSAGLVDIMRSPIVKNIVSGVLQEVLSKIQPSHGLPVSGAQVPSAGLMDFIRNPVVHDIAGTILKQVLAVVQPSHGLPTSAGAYHPLAAAGLPATSAQEPSAFLPFLLPVLGNVLLPIISKVVESHVAHGLPATYGAGTPGYAVLDNALKAAGLPATAATNEPAAFLPFLLPLIGTIAPIVTNLIASHGLPASSGQSVQQPGAYLPTDAARLDHALRAAGLPVATSPSASNEPAAFLPFLLPLLGTIGPLIGKLVASQAAHGLPATSAGATELNTALKAAGLPEIPPAASNEPAAFLPFLLPLISTIGPLVGSLFASQVAHGLPVTSGVPTSNIQSPERPSAFLPALLPFLTGVLAPMAGDIISKVIESRIAHGLPIESAVTATELESAIGAPSAGSPDGPAAFLPGFLTGILPKVLPVLTDVVLPVVSTVAQKIISSRPAHGLPTAVSVAEVEKVIKEMNPAEGATDGPSAFLPGLLTTILPTVLPLATELVNKIISSRAAHGLPVTANGVSGHQNPIKVNGMPQAVRVSA